MRALRDKDRDWRTRYGGAVTSPYDGFDLFWCDGEHGDGMWHGYLDAFGLLSTRSGAWLWAEARQWVRLRAIALHWQEQTLRRLHAPGGSGRIADLASFQRDFG